MTGVIGPYIQIRDSHHKQAKARNEANVATFFWRGENGTKHITTQHWYGK
jgi:hypothetical protein